MRESPVTPEQLNDEASYEVSIRPGSLDEYIGQEKIKENLSVFIEAAKRRGEALDHVLLYGPPGLGKTTLAYIMSREMGVDIKVTSGPVIERPGDLAAILTNLQEHDVLFIDEIHRLSHVVEEILYPAMEDYQMDILIGQGPSRPDDEAGDTALYTGRRDNPGRASDLPAARPVRNEFPAGILFTAGAVLHHEAVGEDPGHPDRPGGRGGNSAAVPGHAAHRQPASPKGPGLCPGPGRWAINREVAVRCSGDAGGGSQGLRPDGPEDSPDPHREVRRRAGRGSKVFRSRSGRSAARSRTSMSPT